MLLALRDAGLDVVAFDGPGQGAAFDAGLPMTAEWHKPVGAVLDHFGVDDVTLMGFSLGGCLVMRAAAIFMFELLSVGGRTTRPRLDRALVRRHRLSREIVLALNRSQLR
jgi:alpha-beta hydrolase superfamily lysophospholipase